MDLVSKLNKIQAIFPLFLGMIIILFSSEFNISSVYGALIWTFSLSMIECTISYLDKLSQDDSCLLLKEASVGLGSALTVYCVRFFSPQEGVVYIGLLSIVFLFVGTILLADRKCSAVYYLKTR